MTMKEKDRGALKKEFNLIGFNGRSAIKSLVGQRLLSSCCYLKQFQSVLKKLSGGHINKNCVANLNQPKEGACGPLVQCKQTEGARSTQ